MASATVDLREAVGRADLAHIGRPRARWGRDHGVSEALYLGGEEPVLEKKVFVVRGGTLRGTVLNRERAPCRDAIVGVDGMSGRSGPEGHFEIPRLHPAKKRMLWIFAASYAHFRNFEVRRNPDTYVLSPDPSHRILRVSGPDGVDLSDKVFGFSWFDKDGKRPGGGMMFIRAKHGFITGDHKKGVLWDGGEARRFAPRLIDLENIGDSELSVMMEEGCTLRGSLATDNGKPVVTAGVTVTME